MVLKTLPVRLRLEREQEMSMLEFSYMVIQAYDFVELFNHFNCRLQIGGSEDRKSTRLNSSHVD